MNQLCQELRRYAADSRNAKVSEHQHYGPYSYLKFVTWTERKIVADGIYSCIEDFNRLAEVVTDAIAIASLGDRIRIDGSYAAANDARLELLLESDDFEAGSADPALANVES